MGSDGGKNSYYDVFEGCTDVDSFCLKHNVSFAEGNILKALVGIINAKNGKGSRHYGTGIIRDCRKIVHYADLILKEEEGKWNEVKSS